MQTLLYIGELESFCGEMVQIENVHLELIGVVGNFLSHLCSFKHDQTFPRKEGGGGEGERTTPNNT